MLWQPKKLLKNFLTMLCWHGVTFFPIYIFLRKKDYMRSKYGCQKCGHKAAVKSVNTEYFIKEAKEKFPEFDYSKVKNIENRNSKAEIICPKHGSFFATAYLFLKNGKCPICSKEKNHLQVDEVKKICKEKWGDKYIYDKINFSLDENIGKQKIEIICPKHGSFITRYSDFIRGHG